MSALPACAWSMTVGAPLIVKWLYGPKFAAAAPLLQILIWSEMSVFFGALVAEHFGGAEPATISDGARRRPARLYNVLLNLYLIPRYSSRRRRDRDGGQLHRRMDGGSAVFLGDPINDIRWLENSVAGFAGGWEVRCGVAALLPYGELALRLLAGVVDVCRAGALLGRIDPPRRCGVCMVGGGRHFSEGGIG